MPALGMVRRQAVREVGARALRHRTAAVIGSVRDGERIIVMRHAEPQAVLLSVRDAIKLLVEPELRGLASAAEQDFERAQVEDLGPPGPFRIMLAREAVRSGERMGARDRRMLRDILVRDEPGDEPLLWLPSGRWLAAFSYVDETTALVHQVWAVRQLERALLGEVIWRRRQRVAIDRGLHGRAWWQIGEEREEREEG